MEKIQVIILAGGHGKRMQNGQLAKVLQKINGKPILLRLLHNIAQTKLFPKPVIVVGQKANQVMQACGKNYTYVFQKNQLGTGHAVLICKNKVNNFQNILVLYGDHPFLTAKSIKKIVLTHLSKKVVLTMATVKIPNFNSWYKCFIDWGRIVRNKQKQMIKVVEAKDANQAEKLIKEVNPSFFCFSATWLWENVPKLKNYNTQREYYLPDLVKFAIDQGQKLATVAIKPEEAIGINTPEQLKLAETLYD